MDPSSGETSPLPSMDQGTSPNPSALPSKIDMIEDIEIEMPPDSPSHSITEMADDRPLYEMSSLKSTSASTKTMNSVTFSASTPSLDAGRRAGPQSSTTTDPTATAAASASAAETNTNTNTTTIVDEAQECLAQSLLMFLYADLRLLSATGRINTKFETLCIDSDRVPRTSAAEMAGTAASLKENESYCGEGVSPGQIMAILIVELRQEVMAQRKRVKEQIKKKAQAGWNPMEEDDDDEEGSDDDDDAGVMNKITDRKGRKEFETDMHALIRSYNDMLGHDLKGIPEVKLERMFTNPLRRVRGVREPMGENKNRRSVWLRPGLRPQQLTQRLFSLDELERKDQTGQDSDDEGSKKSQGSLTNKKFAIPAMFSKSKKNVGAASREPTDVMFESEGVDGRMNNDPATEDTPLSRLSGIAEAKSQEEEEEEEVDAPKEVMLSGSGIGLGNGGEHNGEAAPQQKSPDETAAANASGAGPQKMKRSALFDIIESMRGMTSPQSPDECDLHSLKSDPGPNQGGGWNPELAGNSSRRAPPKDRGTLTKQLTQHFKDVKDYAEKVREDHVLHNKLIIPAEDYTTFAGAEDVGNKLVKMTSSLNLSTLGMSALPRQLDEMSDRNMSEKELLDFMTKCIESRNVDSLDFMADFFRDNTVSQTMVKSKAQVVWLQDWFPIKDCIYAISVDKKKKRVLVVFRGAITHADWSHGFDAAMKKGQNPIKEAYEGKKRFLKYHRGFYTYLFRTRKDTSSRKYDEIANKVHEYGTKMIGSDFTVTVNGYSLGGALSVLFGLHASADERFTRNGPVKIFSYGAPMAVGHSFADAFRHQEKNKKVQHARFYNNNDIVAHLPFNFKPTKRGSNFVHVGIDVKLYPVPGQTSLYGGRYPRIRYNDCQPSIAAYWRAIKTNALLNGPLPWLIKDKHGLAELQKRIARAILVVESAQMAKNSFLERSLDEAYEAMVYSKKD